MRAVVKNGVGVFTPQGFLDGNNLTRNIDFIQEILRKRG